MSVFMVHEPSLFAEIKRLCLEHPAAADMAIADMVVGDMAEDVRLRVLIDLVSDGVSSYRRSVVRDIERSAAQAEAEAARKAAWAATRESYESERQERRAYWERNPWSAPRHTKVYRAWAQTPEGIARIKEWTESDARGAERRERMRDNPMGYLMDTIKDFYEEAKTAGKLELTRELLESSFALGDGTRVTWGDATADQHRERIALLMQNVEGNMATLVIHERAVAMLVEGGARCLNVIGEAQAA